MDTARALRQALVMLVGATVVALVGGGAWWALGDTSFRIAVAIALMLVGALVGFTGSQVLSRAEDSGARAMLGLAPEPAERDDSVGGLTGLGVFVFVALPLVAVGMVLYGSG